MSLLNLQLTLSWRRAKRHTGQDSGPSLAAGGSSQSFRLPLSIVSGTQQVAGACKEGQSINKAIISTCWSFLFPSGVLSHQFQFHWSVHQTQLWWQDQPSEWPQVQLSHRRTLSWTLKACWPCSLSPCPTDHSGWPAWTPSACSAWTAFLSWVCGEGAESDLHHHTTTWAITHDHIESCHDSPDINDATPLLCLELLDAGNHVVVQPVPIGAPDHAG